MPTLVHISDLHFGAVTPGAADALAGAIHDIDPDVVIVSGDLTLRGDRTEFADARAFLQRLDSPIVCTPGNHDVPSRNLFERFLRPWRRYDMAVESVAAPLLVNNDVALISINSARPWLVGLNWAHGRVSRGQIAAATGAFRAAPATAFRALVIHHPPTLPTPRPGFAPLPRGVELLNALADAGVDAILTGHLHIPTWVDLDDATRPAQLHAGTTLSSRHRGQPNTFDVMTTRRDGADVVRWRLDEDGFSPTAQRAPITLVRG